MFRFPLPSICYGRTVTIPHWYWNQSRSSILASLSVCLPSTTHGMPFRLRAPIKNCRRQIFNFVFTNETTFKLFNCALPPCWAGLYPVHRFHPSSLPAHSFVARSVLFSLNSKINISADLPDVYVRRTSYVERGTCVRLQNYIWMSSNSGIGRRTLDAAICE